MPSWDLSWEELQTYRGTNPRPDDFEEYWDEALAELERQPAEVLLERAEVRYRSAECFHLWFTGIGGARVHAKALRPTPAMATGAGVAVFHGYTGRSPDWLSLLPYAAEGFFVLAMDCRGQGGLSQDVGGRDAPRTTVTSCGG